MHTVFKTVLHYLSSSFNGAFHVRKIAVKFLVHCWPRFCSVVSPLATQNQMAWP